MLPDAWQPRCAWPHAPGRGPCTAPSTTVQEWRQRFQQALRAVPVLCPQCPPSGQGGLNQAAVIHRQPEKQLAAVTARIGGGVEGPWLKCRLALEGLHVAHDSTP